jgi:tRNA A37 threonylcarbamoyladenosine dehydratase
MKSNGVARQFASTARLFAQGDFARLRAAHIGVIGIGGVGSWAAEALVRSGVGRLTLVDMDHVAESNLNRQVQALHSTLGAAKGQTLQSRLLDVAPDCAIAVVDDFVTTDNVNLILNADPNTIWIDATDDLTAKKAIILWMKDHKQLKHLVVSGAAGGKTDPTKIQVADLAGTAQDALLSTLRYDLRKHHGFPREGRMRIQTVFCHQPTVKSDDCDPAAKLACAGYGSLVTITATMGMVAANLAMLLASKNKLS